MGIVQQIRETIGGGRQVVSEIIGRVSYRVVGFTSRWLRADDRTQADYEFYDNLRRGKLPTYKLGALFAKPIVEHITAWSLGDGFRVVTDDEATTAELNAFVELNLHQMIVWMRDGMSLGDSYLTVNSDGSLTLVPPNQVEIKTNDLDYRDVTSMTVTTVMEKATVEDAYRLDGREIRVKRHNQPEEVQAFPNFIGRLPIVHYPHARQSNEVYGHPIYESLVPLFAEYDDVLTNSLKGVKTMSNPKPVLEGVDDPGEEMDALATREETYTDSAGNTVTERVIDFDELEIFATSGRFDFKAPSTFTGDAWQMMKALFYLMLQHTNVPEWVWGGAIASSMASVQAQMPAWSKFIDGQRREIERYIREVLEVYLATVALYTPGIRADVEITIEWPQVAPDDAKLHLEYVKHAGQRGLITGERELELLNLVKDAAREYEASMAEVAQARQEADRFGPAWEEAMREALERAGQGDEQGEGEGEIT